MNQRQLPIPFPITNQFNEQHPQRQFYPIPDFGQQFQPQPQQQQPFNQYIRNGFGAQEWRGPPNVDEFQYQQQFQPQPQQQQPFNQYIRNGFGAQEWRGGPPNVDEFNFHQHQAPRRQFQPQPQQQQPFNQAGINDGPPYDGPPYAEFQNEVIESDDDSDFNRNNDYSDEDDDSISSENHDNNINHENNNDYNARFNNNIDFDYRQQNNIQMELRNNQPNHNNPLYPIQIPPNHVQQAPIQANFINPHNCSQTKIMLTKFELIEAYHAFAFHTELQNKYQQILEIRKKELILFNNFLFKYNRDHSRRKDKTLVLYYRCLGKCGNTLHINLNGEILKYGTVNHTTCPTYTQYLEKSHLKNEIETIREAIAEQARTTDLQPSVIFSQYLMNREKFGGIFISLETITQWVHRFRQSNQSDEIKYQQFFERTIFRNQQPIQIPWLRQFVSPDKIIYLFTNEMLELFIDSQVLMIDGTFKASPPEFQQILTIMGMKNRKYFPCIHIYLKKKTTKLYKYALANLLVRYVPECINAMKIIIDFEVSLRDAIESIRKEIPGKLRDDVQIHGCLFHYAQAIYRKFRNLIREPTKEQKNLLFILLAFPYIHPTQVYEQFQKIKDLNYPKFANLIAYYQEF